MYGCESWTIQKAKHWRIDAFELRCWRRLESPLDCKEIQPVHPKGDQSWVFFGRTDVEAETLIFWTPDEKSWLIWEDPGAGEDWGQEEKGMTEDEMVGWHYWLNGHGFGWTPGAGDGQGGLTCCSSWGCKESDMIERLNWTELAWNIPLVSLIFLKTSLVFPIQLFSSISLHWSLRKAFLSLLAILWNSAFKWVYLSFSPLFFASLLFTAISKASSDSQFAFLNFFHI